ncbi:hypothetical protein HK405_008141 [Cladochytrium tenue]|nr:hypothetical protein HK405_008141 [Cladochytrium tenue]
MSDALELAALVRLVRTPAALCTPDGRDACLQLTAARLGRDPYDRRAWLARAVALAVSSVGSDGSSSDDEEGDPALTSPDNAARTTTHAAASELPRARPTTASRSVVVVTESGGVRQGARSLAVLDADLSADAAAAGLLVHPGRIDVAKYAKNPALARDMLRTRIALARVLLRQRKAAEAHSVLRDARHRFPLATEPLLLLSRLLEAEEARTSDAAACLKQVLVLDAGNLEALERLAQHYFEAGQPEIAHRYHIRILQLGHTTAWAFCNAGMSALASSQRVPGARLIARGLALAASNDDPGLRAAAAAAWSNAAAACAIHLADHGLGARMLRVADALAVQAPRDGTAGWEEHEVARGNNLAILDSLSVWSQTEEDTSGDVPWRRLSEQAAGYTSGAAATTAAAAAATALGNASAMAAVGGDLEAAYMLARQAAASAAGGGAGMTGLREHLDRVARGLEEELL